MEHKVKMSEDTVFRLISMSKPVAYTALMMPYEECRFSRTDPCARYIPEFRKLRVLRNPDGPFDDTVEPERPPTIGDLVLHTAGFTHGLGTTHFDDQCARANVFGLNVLSKT